MDLVNDAKNVKPMTQKIAKMQNISYGYQCYPTFSRLKQQF
jgi:hypothetical protein